MRIVQKTFFLAVIAIGTACSDREPETVRIGVLAVSGQYSDVSGVPTTRGSALAAQLVNDRGQLSFRGRPARIELVMRVHEDRPDAAASAARALINQENVAAIIGPQLSRHAIPAAVIANDAHVPLLSPMSSSPKTTEGRPYVFRLAFRDDFQGGVLARFAYEQLGARRAAILFDEAAEYSEQVAGFFSSTFQELGGEVVSTEVYTTDVGTEFGGQLRVIKRSDPDVLLLPNQLPFVETQMVEARALGIDAVFLGGDNWDALRLMHVPEAEGSFVAHQWRPDVPTEAAAEFGDVYRGEFGEDPRSTAAMTFDAVTILALAMTNAGSIDPDSIAGALRSIVGFSGVTGTISFGGSNDPERSAVITEIGRGEYMIRTVIDP